MDYHLKQWRNQHQSEPPASAKIPRLVEPHHPPSGTALPLFVPEPNSSSSRINNLSAIPDSASTRFPRLGGFFSLAQWQELELQALIFKYLLAGAAVPAELLQPIKKSFLNIPACYLHHHPQYQHYQPAMLQSGYWGRSVMDPEPGRCRRTDGKKWRCSRDVVAGQKYCERHMHRGRNRSRKPVEIPTPTSTGGGLKTTIPIAASPITAVANGTHFTLSGSSPSVNLFHLNQRSSEFKTGDGSVVETHHEKVSSEDGQDGQILRHFFDDWPRSNHEPNAGGTNASPENSTTSLSISIQENASSDFSLKLSTGNGDGTGAREANTGGEEQPLQLNWAAGWGTHPVASMGGPLAEALRSSTSNSSSSPTSVLHERQRGSASDSVST